jgi:hypothetical protein
MKEMLRVIQQIEETLGCKLTVSLADDGSLALNAQWKVNDTLGRFMLVRHFKSEQILYSRAHEDYFVWLFIAEGKQVQEQLRRNTVKGGENSWDHVS